ncbi:hypothetical protein PaG_03759 [Moesziomyces aphidis]|uniref:Uncharacterized protein n=1 Tax=Moesziomyces aphidis TaxID=84754 RepID=W3VKW3_MOEAP|nr:hypothetical protein PaG_03759 [Moesziomyces aphidis]
MAPAPGLRPVHGSSNAWQTQHRRAGEDVCSDKAVLQKGAGVSSSRLRPNSLQASLAAVSRNPPSLSRYPDKNGAFKARVSAGLVRVEFRTEPRFRIGRTSHLHIAKTRQHSGGTTSRPYLVPSASPKMAALSAPLKLMSAFAMTTGLMDLVTGVGSLELITGVSLPADNRAAVFVDSQLRFLGGIWAGYGAMLWWASNNFFDEEYEDEALLSSCLWSDRRDVQAGQAGAPTWTSAAAVLMNTMIAASD